MRKPRLTGVSEQAGSTDARGKSPLCERSLLGLLFGHVVRIDLEQAKRTSSDAWRQRRLPCSTHRRCPKSASSYTTSS
jgi:hypothetical protein